MKRTALPRSSTSATALPATVQPSTTLYRPDEARPAGELRERAEQTPTDGARGHAEQAAAACPVYRDCTETAPGHYDHFNYDVRVTGEDGDTILDAGMTAVSDGCGAVISIRNEDFTSAAAVRAKTAELRHLLDQVDAMADRVFADHQGCE